MGINHACCHVFFNTHLCKNSACILHVSGQHIFNLYYMLRQYIAKLTATGNLLSYYQLVVSMLIVLQILEYWVISNFLLVSYQDVCSS